MPWDDEEQERVRLERERQLLAPLDRLYRRSLHEAADGCADVCERHSRARRVRISALVSPKVKAMMALIQKRDGIPSQAVLLELMLDAYLKENGQLDESGFVSSKDPFAAMEERSQRPRKNKIGTREGNA